MGLSVQNKNGQLVGVSHDELGKEVRSDLSPLLVLGGDLHCFLKPILDDMRLKRPATVAMKPMLWAALSAISY